MRNLLRRAGDYYAVCKPRVVALIVFTAIVGMFLAVPGMVPLGRLVFATLGIGLAAASAAAINHLLDRRIDAEMARTRNRPLPKGNLSGAQVLAFALSLAVISMAILVFLVNPLTAILTLVSVIGYAVIYTVYLKRATPQNIVIGGAAGAAPPVLGWTAMTGQVSPYALLLFLIIFTWTPPHFWALAIHRREEYARVDMPMLPVTHGVRFTGWHIIFYTVLLVLVSLLPYLTRMSGLLYLAIAVLLGGWFLYYAVKLNFSDDRTLPMKTFGFSIVYLMGLFSALLIDHYLPPVGVMF
ncbi:MAG: heme o synthase [Gammaproteobacteria bacterium]|jgi:protoheme IX farnesyltransferase